MAEATLAQLTAEIAALKPTMAVGRISSVGRGAVELTGLSEIAALGDQVWLGTREGRLRGEIVHIDRSYAMALPDGSVDGIRLGDQVMLQGGDGLYPDLGWQGRIIDPYGNPLDGRPLPRGPDLRPLRPHAPPATQRKRLGTRLGTGLAVFDTLLPIVRGQRLGLFAGSGVGKSSLLGALGRGLQADRAVIALVGERGRELRHFIEDVLGPEGMARSVIVAATSDQSAIARRRCLWTAMTVAEHMRDAGEHVLFLADSVTRFAEAHREVALAAGEPASLRGYPPSTAHMIMALAERAGPGLDGAGDITAIFSVLMAGSDMEEPVADILRGVLDGHVVLAREIAERGRFPAVDLLRSASRSLPEAASAEENALIGKARRRLGAYDRAELMIQSGLYSPGSDPEIDAAIRCYGALDGFLADRSDGPSAAFKRLRAILGPG
ncbi:FliI/YscN family ATPase [Oceanicola sp. 502str15]|uniref:FliI/YscN family ATPase n=1 Tax=Oceanicola sp. 502str15 TaxID=2696061 RepID=UPI0020942FB1|nr:FliI/YscN family ATPase [Oceanicola sp. 502str15]MCO6384770.1 FliI/YscN family ATPase [Oceanicola sp. 502str15]